jgi:hypothetical protein
MGFELGAIEEFAMQACMFYAYSYSIKEHSNHFYFFQFCVIKHLVIFSKKLAKLVKFTLGKKNSKKNPDLCGKK